MPIAMKKSILFAVALLVATTGFSQKNRTSVNQGKQVTEKSSLEQWRGELKQTADKLNKLAEQMGESIESLERLETQHRSVAAPPVGVTDDPVANLVTIMMDISQRLDALNDSIDSVYKRYNDNKLFSDKEYRNNVFAKLDNEIRTLRAKEDSLNVVIVNGERKLQWVDKLRAYYEDTDIDTLYAHSDLVSLDTHIKILGTSHPKVMDELKVLFEGKQLLFRKMDPTGNAKARNNLKKVRDCDSKEYLDGLLAVHKEVTEEVEKWLRENNHGMYDAQLLYRRIDNNYGVSLDTDFPYLAGKVREKVKESIKMSNKRK